MKERLSKPQRWILKRCFEKGKFFIARQALLNEYRQNRNLDPDSAEVTLTKSLRNLRDKDYLELLDKEYNALFDHSYSQMLGLEAIDETHHKVKYISLTERGIRKATQSLSEKT